MRKTVPVPWAPAGGTETLHTNTEGNDERREAIASEQAKLQKAITSVLVDSESTTDDALAALARKRREVMAAGPVAVARAAMSVRQERARRLQARAAAAAKQNMMRTPQGRSGEDGTGGSATAAASANPIKTDPGLSGAQLIEKSLAALATGKGEAETWHLNLTNLASFARTSGNFFGNPSDYSEGIGGSGAGWVVAAVAPKHTDKDL